MIKQGPPAAGGGCFVGLFAVQQIGGKLFWNTLLTVWTRRKQEGYI
jgi:hypothetical protein